MNTISLRDDEDEPLKITILKARTSKMDGKLMYIDDPDPKRCWACGESPCMCEEIDRQIDSMQEEAFWENHGA